MCVCVCGGRGGRLLVDGMRVAVLFMADEDFGSLGLV